MIEKGAFYAFVGAREINGTIVGADTIELKELATRALSEGAVIGPNTSYIWDRITAIMPSKVVVAGGFARTCVADTVAWALLTEGVQSVVVKLPNIRAHSEDSDTDANPDVIVMRKEYLIKGLRELAEDERLTILD